MGAPPSVVGAVQVTVAPALPGVAVTLVGAPGAWAPVGVAVIATLLTAWRSVMPPSPAVKPSRVVGDRVTGVVRTWAPSTQTVSWLPATWTRMCRVVPRRGGTADVVVFQVRLSLLVLL